MAELAEIRGYSARLSRITIVLLFNTLITKHSFIPEKLEMSFIFSFFCPTHDINMHIAGYLLTTDNKYSVHHDNIWAVLKCAVMNNNNDDNNYKNKYSRTSTNGHLSTTATSLQRPLFLSRRTVHTLALV